MRMANECWEISANYIKDTPAYKSILADIYKAAKQGYVSTQVMLEKALEDRKNLITTLLTEEGFECRECGKTDHGSTYLSISWCNYIRPPLESFQNNLRYQLKGSSIARPFLYKPYLRLYEKHWKIEKL